MELGYFFDTYALIEIAKGENENYRKYLKTLFVTTKLNLMELYFVFVRENQKEKATAMYSEILRMCIPISDGVFMGAAEMRLKYLKLDLSYVDCIGYILSENLGIRFLTGDSKFRNFKNVEFVQ